MGFQLVLPGFPRVRRRKSRRAPVPPSRSVRPPEWRIVEFAARMHRIVKRRLNDPVCPDRERWGALLGMVESILDIMKDD